MILIEKDAFYVRNSTKGDIPLYAKLLHNAEWKRNSGFNEDNFLNNAQIELFLSKSHPNDIRWVCFHGDKGFVAFVHFNVSEDGFATAIGGIHPQYLNSGVGLKYYTWCVDLYFKQNITKRVRSNVYQENLRSCKMNIGLGFELVSLKMFGNLKYDVYEIDREHFYNSTLVKRYLK
ncbi:MAG: hypothetical protein MR455_08600 [Prevotella sp.]|nr:hypothetical protein [Prevotella sp.]